ncbi:MAG: helix-turn-helix transcriptional regulator [Clostridia bacterium]|nr:helix-turn-helix transcriptional regulator [Clostridia bacterium]
MLNESCTLYERYENTPGPIAQKIFYYPQWSGHFVCRKDFRINRHGYKSILLLYSMSGQGIIHYRGNAEVLKSGQFALINCVDEHTYYPEGKWEFEFLHFFGANCADMYEYIYTLSGGFIFDDSTGVRSVLESVIEMNKNGISREEAEASKSISDILYSVIGEKQRSHSFIKVCDHIEQNIKNVSSVGELAGKFGFSRCYFSTEFKKATGTTVYEYITRCRLTHAKNLLVKSDMTVSQIAECVGYTDSTTFIRAFGVREGISPLQYKKAMTGRS